MKSYTDQIKHSLVEIGFEIDRLKGLLNERESFIARRIPLKGLEAEYEELDTRYIKREIAKLIERISKW